MLLHPPTGRRARRSQQRPWAADGPWTPTCTRSWAHFSGPRSQEALPPVMSAAQAPHRKADGAFYGSVGARGLGKRPQEVQASRPGPTNPTAVPSLLGTPCIRCWALQGPGEGPGKALTTELPSRQRLRWEGSRSPPNPA